MNVWQVFIRASQHHSKQHEYMKNIFLPYNRVLSCEFSTGTPLILTDRIITKKSDFFKCLQTDRML